MNAELSQETWTHGSSLSDATDALSQAADAARREANRLLTLPDTVAPSESGALEAARAGAKAYLGQEASLIAHAVAELLGFCNLWRSSAGHMRKLAETTTPEARVELAQGVRLLLRGARTRLAFFTPLAGKFIALRDRLAPVPRTQDGRLSEVTPHLDALKAALTDVVAATQALHSAWEALTKALEAAAALLDSPDTEASAAWLSERLAGAAFGWNRAHSTAQRLQRGAPLPL